jgi:hypothetical protein
MKYLLPLLLLLSCNKTEVIPHQENKLTAQQRDLAAYLGLQNVQTTPLYPNQQIKHFRTKEEAKAWMDQVKMQGYFINDREVKISQRENPEAPNDNTDNVPDADKGKDQTMGGSNTANQIAVSFTDIWGICGMNVSFTYGYDANGVIQAAGFAGTLVGVYMFTGFDSKQYTVHVTNGTIYFTIMGFQTYGLMIEGIGVVTAKQPARINGSYNVTTGAHTTHYIAD